MYRQNQKRRAAEAFAATQPAEEVEKGGSDDTRRLVTPPGNTQTPPPSPLTPNGVDTLASPLKTMPKKMLASEENFNDIGEDPDEGIIIITS